MSEKFHTENRNNNPWPVGVGFKNHVSKPEKKLIFRWTLLGYSFNILQCENLVIEFLFIKNETDEYVCLYFAFTENSKVG